MHGRVRTKQIDEDAGVSQVTSSRHVIFIDSDQSLVRNPGR
jgi:hypothetical protein